jgi:pimeloyl-ACP methyl ester carboxylesterase
MVGALMSEWKNYMRLRADYLRLSLIVLAISAATCCLCSRGQAEPPGLVEPPVFSGLTLVGTSYQAHDTIQVGEERTADARECLEGLCWPASEFSVHCEAATDWRFDSLVRFPSALETGDQVNDRVALEWHMARNPQGEIVKAPAVVVVHESGSKMPVGKMFAFLLSRHQMHAFMIHLPGYGERRSEARPKSAASLFRLTRQSITDVRRARDAIATMPMVDADHVSIQGTSLGDAFDGVFLMLCGGDLYNVLQTGKRDSEKMRRQMAEEGLAGEELRQLLYTIEPTRIAHRLQPQRTWLFSGRFDDVVPLANANLLAKAANLSAEHHVLYDVDHYSGVTRIPEMIKRIQDEINALSSQ